jgi:hypothetical protein
MQAEAPKHGDNEIAFCTPIGIVTPEELQANIALAPMPTAAALNQRIFWGELVFFLVMALVAGGDAAGSAGSTVSRGGWSPTADRYAGRRRRRLRPTLLLR